MPLTAYTRLSSYPVSDELTGQFAAHLNLLAGEYIPGELSLFLRSAASFLERETGRVYFPGEYKVLAAMQRESRLVLPVYPVTHLVECVLDSGNSLPGALVYDGGRYLFDAGVRITGSIELTVAAGYTDAFPAPECYLAAIFAVAADLYEHRESQSERQLYDNKTLKFILDNLRCY